MAISSTTNLCKGDMTMNGKRGHLWVSVGIVVVALLFLGWSPRAQGLTLDEENRITVVLSDGTQVGLIGQAASQGVPSRKYYYLPVNLRCAKTKDGTPQFLFVKFTTEERGGASGALMHFLMEWGLTPEQEADLKSKLKSRYKEATLEGAVPMVPGNAESGSFQVVSGTLSDKGMTNSLVTSGQAPLLPGGMAAVAARLGKEGAQLLATTFEQASSITDVSLALNFGYETLVPAAKGTITFNWERLRTERDRLEAQYKSDEKRHGFLFISWTSSSTRSYDEMRSHYEFLSEKEIIKINFEEKVADERVAKIREAFFQYFLDSMAEPTDPEGGAPAKPSDKEKEQVPNIRYGKSYRYTTSAFEHAFAQKTKIVDLNYSMSIRWPYQIVGNLKTWYDGVRHNPKCIASVNLNDPFFMHRDIQFILDLDAKEMFEEAVNYVQANVRKRRSSGRDFQDSLVFDAGYIKTNGIARSLTYARGDDTNSDLYEYQVQWSLRGGDIFPENPPWQRGTWEGITLTPPVAARTIELEGDLDKMEESSIPRITAQIHYPRFGREMEANIHLSVAGKQPLVTQRIFMDRDAKGYAYRLIVNHVPQGKLVLPWTAQASDNYIYALIPEDLLQESSETHGRAVEAAKTLGNSPNEKVLDKVFGGIQ